MRAMLTPPYHFGIVAAPIGGGAAATPDVEDQAHILYRGAFPAARNAPFLNRLGIKTLVCLRKKAFSEEDPIVAWAVRKGIDVQWIKAERMSEESLGMERDQVNDVLQILLNTAAYPVYLADVDGISHTSLVVACLRKLQGWQHDSIVNEIYRFEPDQEDLPLVPFINTYLSTSLPSKDDPGAALVLPAPPYPSWLWPCQVAPPALQATRSTLPSTNHGERAGTGSPIVSALPFPNPLIARRHPNMRLTFTSVPNQPAQVDKGGVGLWRTRSNTAISRVSAGDRPRAASPSRSREDSLLSQSSDEPRPHRVSFSDNARRSGVLSGSPLIMPTPSQAGPSGLRWSDEPEEREGDDSAIDDAEDEAFILDDDDEDGDDQDVTQRDENGEEGEGDYDDAEDSEEYDEDEEEEDEDEEEEDDENDPPTSQYISALDLAGFDR